MKNFDLDYKLEQFRKEHLTDLFDENGKKYTGVGISNSETETMLELINELEKEVLKIESIEITKCCKTCDYLGINNNVCKDCNITERNMWKINSEFSKLDCKILRNKHFNNAVEPAIRYLLENHNPHTSIYIHYDTAELLTGEKCHNLSSEVPD
jgi:hypothetical protein